MTACGAERFAGIPGTEAAGDEPPLFLWYKKRMSYA